ARSCVACSMNWPGPKRNRTREPTMETWKYVLGISCLVLFIVGCIGSILYDLGILREDPEKARRRRERQSEDAHRQRIARENEKKRRQEELDQIAAAARKEAERVADEIARLRRATDGQAARKHLMNYYTANKFLIEHLYPQSLMEAFIRCEMREEKSP